MDLESLTAGEKVAGAGAVLTVLGAFLPWADAGIITMSGIDGDGVLTLVFGLGVIGLVLVRDWDVIDMGATALLGLLTVLIAGNVFSNFGGQAAGDVIEVSPGTGLLLTLLGGIAMLAAAVYGFLEEREETGEPGAL